MITEQMRSSTTSMTEVCADTMQGRVLILADSELLNRAFLPAFRVSPELKERTSPREHHRVDGEPGVVSCRYLEEALEALQEPGGFQVAFLSTGICADADLLSLAERVRQGQSRARVVCCNIDGHDIVDAPFDEVLCGPPAREQVRAIGRALLDASRACAERDVALAQLHVADRLGSIRHWLWDRRSGRVELCTSMATLLELDSNDSEANVDAVLERIHPQDRARVVARMQRARVAEGSFTMEYRILCGDGSQRAVRQESSLESMSDAGEWMACAVTVIEGEQGARETIRKLAYFDPLTELPNRSFLNEHLRSVLVHARRHDRLVAILHVNLDGFKRVNDTLGHDAGDRMLQEVALRLQSCVRDSDCVAREQGAALWPDDTGEDAVARFGADEFIVVLSEIATSQDPESVAERIVATVREPVRLDGRELIIGASVGISVYPEDAETEDVLLRNAGLALQSARRRGRNSYRRFDETLLTPSVDRLNLEAKLRHAIDGSGLSLHYQPKVAAVTGEVVGAEALLRWDHPELGSVPPSQFIPIAEETGLILPLGEWVLSEVCSQLGTWRGAGFGRIPVSINVSAQQLYDQGLVRKVTDSLDSAGLAPSDLEFEITESVLMDHVGDGEQRLRDLKALGSLISMDDFGTGYSSLSYLKRLPIDVVKIDRSFVRDILLEEDDQAILRAIIAMAHQLRLRIVAEGVESDDQMALLQAMDCDLIQGYVVSRPVCADAFAARFLSSNRRLAS